MAATLPEDVIELGAARAPGVLLLHPWWGVTGAVRAWADDLVGAGRRVVLPDLYGGVTVSTEDAAEARAQAAIADPTTMAVLERCADSLAGDAAPWAAVGFSLGAFFACRLLGRGDRDPSELVLFYGGATPAGSAVGARLADLHVAPGDPWFDDAELDEVESGLLAAGVEVTVHRYEGSGHWFAEQGSPGYDEAAAALARERVLHRLGVDPR